MFDTLNWQPPTPELLRQQASLLNKIRAYFEVKGVLEVNTPYLSPATTPDPAIRSVKAYLHKTPSSSKEQMYLHTSPEFAMKRLLANGSGDIYQLCQVFRDSDVSPIHNPEFTLLEWYRLGFDHHQLMDELFDLVTVLIGETLQRVDYSYKALFEKYTGINPFLFSLQEAQAWCDDHTVTYPDTMQTMDEFLDLILSFYIQPQFTDNQMTFIYDYPVTQAALAKVRQEPTPVASRFEMYWGNMELANGFHELQDAEEQRQRFAAENATRKEAVIIDEAFLQGLEKGLPDCSGVALGISRLFLKLGVV